MLAGFGNYVGLGIEVPGPRMAVQAPSRYAPSRFSMAGKYASLTMPPRPRALLHATAVPTTMYKATASPVSYGMTAAPTYQTAGGTIKVAGGATVAPAPSWIKSGGAAPVTIQTAGGTVQYSAVKAGPSLLPPSWIKSAAPTTVATPAGPVSFIPPPTSGGGGGGGGGDYMPSETPTEETPPVAPPEEKKGPNWLLIGGIAAAVWFLFLRKKRS